MRLRAFQGPDFSSSALWSAYRVFYPVAVVFTASFVLLFFLISPGINGYEKAMFGDMIYGTAHKPFVYRFLLSGVVRLIVALIPSGMRDAMVHSELHLFNWESYLLPEYFVAIILMCASLIGFCYAVKYIFRGVFQSSTLTMDVVSIIALAGLPSFLSITVTFTISQRCFFLP
jgi:hypothetical protein